MADIDVKLRCPERLVFNETLKRCDWPEATICKGGNILLEGEDNSGYCADKVNKKIIRLFLKEAFRLFSFALFISLMETFPMNNIAIVIIYVKTEKTLYLHVKIIYDIRLTKMNVIGLLM